MSKRILFFIPFFVALVVGLSAGCGGDREGSSATAVERRVLDPKASLFLMDGQQAYKQGTYGRALALVDSAAVYAPAFADVYFLRGHILTRLYRFDEAQAAFDSVLALDPAYRGAAFNMGNNAFLLGNNREAIRHYRREQALFDRAVRGGARSDAVEERTERAMVRLQIGRVYARLGVADSARMAYEEALAIDTSNGQAAGWLAELYEDEGEPETALTYARRALALEPDNATYQYLVGTLCVRTGALAEGAGYLETVVRQEPWHVGAHHNLGRALLALGREEEAQRYLEAVDPLQELDSEIVLARFALHRNPEDPAYWKQLGDLLRRAGRVEEAREVYNVIRQLNH